MYSVFLVGIVVGFFITCLLGLLRFELFAWGLQMMQPLAMLFLEI
ncbi:putative membrane protein (plasmid) [Pseudomonas paraeruginosa]|uniref:Membrane protein n=1 Tax=Pseudomonas paraeruginosa TaxID=2994495 RepID=A0A2R3IKV9_9PSED|nr:putative membrane protein [Pseudomonas paraeruginosa]AWE88857.1 putative membrane protein [Pseudomonas paraeruginosa]